MSMDTRLLHEPPFQNQTVSGVDSIDLPRQDQPSPAPAPARVPLPIRPPADAGMPSAGQELAGVSSDIMCPCAGQEDHACCMRLLMHKGHDLRGWFPTILMIVVTVLISFGITGHRYLLPAGLVLWLSLSLAERFPSRGR